MAYKVVALASLYEPLEFLEDKIANFNSCDTSNTLIYWYDVSSEATWRTVDRLIREKCKFEYRLNHNQNRQTLYWVWDWIIEQINCGTGTSYFCNTNVDDLLDPQYFQKMSKFLDDNQNIQIIASPWGVTNIKHQQWPPNMDSGLVNPDISKTCGHFPMWRSSLHSSVGLFDPRMVCIGDSHFWGRIRAKYGLEAFTCHAEYLGCYLSHANNLYHTSRGPNGCSGEAYDRSLM